MIVGVDEVGRGAWAGPMLVCAVNYQTQIEGLKDSKKLSANKRAILANQILQSNEVGFGWVSNDEIDDMGLSICLKLAAARALQEIDYRGQAIITDGNINLFPILENSKAVVKADDTEPAVSAASIVAKVARDARMELYDSIYSGYNFANNVGYGTKAHRDAIKLLGISKIHRKSFKI